MLLFFYREVFLFLYLSQRCVMGDRITLPIDMRKGSPSTGVDEEKCGNGDDGMRRCRENGEKVEELNFL
jgi:hypothetical protein